MLVVLTLVSAAHAQDDSFRKGSWDIELTGGYITPIRFSEDKFYNVNIAAGYHLVDNLSFGPEVQAYYIDQPDENAIAAGVGVLGRWRFLNVDRFSVFIDGGGGVVYADPQVPQFGTHFNFTGKGGFGASFQLSENFHVLAGVRYFHLSNGNIHGRDQNPSYDGIQIWGGIEWKF
ncbi:MAG TPA: acyloxyacyl hydrolase [Tepidisphaeraceae bacterium]|jgi:opacity protein-like surface antigen